MYQTSTAFHTGAVTDNVITRLRCVFSDGTTLNGNRVKISSGVTLTETFNKEEDMTLGGCRSATIDLTVLNDDSALNDFDYGKCTIYLDQKVGGEWEACPLGVFIIDKPKIRRKSQIKVSAYDQMSLADAIADEWYDGLTYPITLGEMFTSLCTAIGVTEGSTADALNLDMSFPGKQFEASQMTYREILGYIAEAAGCMARFDRDGKLELAWFRDVTNTDFGSIAAFSAEISEYTVAKIDKVQISATDTDIGTIVGSGTNGYTILGNPFLSGDSEEDTVARADPVIDRLTDFDSYTPVTVKCMCDWSVQAGDIMQLTLYGKQYRIPIFKQKVTWYGGSAKVTYTSTGNARRETMSAENRKSFSTEKAIHELEITAEKLRTAIQNTNGKQTELLQTAEQMISTALREYVKESEVGDKIKETVSSEISQTADELRISLNQQISDLAGETSDQFNEISTYIRFDASGVVIGKTDSNIKLKLANNILYFFTGSETDITTQNTIAYFSDGKLFVDSAQINKLTIGGAGKLVDTYIVGTGVNTCIGFIGRLS